MRRGIRGIISHAPGRRSPLGFGAALTALPAVSGERPPSRRPGRSPGCTPRPSKRERRAPAADVARARFNDYAPLLRLGRTGEALDLLLECRQVFQDANVTDMLGKTLSALGDVEDKRGHGDAAIRMERDALRYTYLAGDAMGIAVSYHNLGNYLHRHARQPGPALACHLASALICAVTGADDGGLSVRAAAADLHEFGAATLPADVAGLCDQIGEIPGTDLRRLLTALGPDPAATEHALRALIAEASSEAATLS